MTIHCDLEISQGVGTCKVCGQTMPCTFEPCSMWCLSCPEHPANAAPVVVPDDFQPPSFTSDEQLKALAAEEKKDVKKKGCGCGGKVTFTKAAPISAEQARQRAKELRQKIRKGLI